jgi:hypothetical protein
MKPIRFYSPVVTQAQLAEIRTMDVSIRRLTRARESKMSAILDSLAHGATVEPGPHDAELIERKAGSRMSQRVVVV